ncbi:UBX domain-containing protein 4 isoform X2 [Phlebotomus argentipes]|uniref:UBX domain-containing protein 4 isoform X2 n=1 Tax=Phlebotomus argentipes TaxID=94469 RepID=UPI0028934E67|nr:UBX domain-containing protein 4 isoform X2 [Phlebotomus argentipes]
MNWFQGSIAEAVTLSKRKNAVFVVFVAGTDESSTNLGRLIDSDLIRKHLESEKFVAIRIDSGSEAYMQFAQIYQLVPLPSVFFIGQNGTPVDIVTSLTTTVEDLEQKILGVLSRLSLSTPSSSAGEEVKPAVKEDKPVPVSQGASSSGAAEKTAVKEEKVTEECAGGVCRRVETENPPKPEARPEMSAEEKLNRAKEMLEKKRKEKEAEEARAEREKEIQRRRQGQDVASLKKWQEEQEIKQLREDRMKEKKEAAEARKKILEQIEQDKLERAQRFAPVVPKSPPLAPMEEHNYAAADNSDTSRIQFKTPSGGTEIHVFASTDQFATVHSFVQTELLSGSGITDFALATTFPRKEFSQEHYSQTLSELRLTPTAVLLILPRGRGVSGGGVGSTQVATTSAGRTAIHFFTSLFWSFFTPVMSVLSYMRNWVFPRQDQGQQKRAAEDQISDHDAAKRRNLEFPGDSRDGQQPSTSKSAEAAYRRLGSSNIHRLHDKKDSDDENNTWNGNSTQQM